MATIPLVETEAIRTYQRGSYQPSSRRQRMSAAAMSAAILIIALLIALLQSTQVMPKFGGGRTLTTFNVKEVGADSAKAPAKQRQQQKTAHPPQPRTPPGQPKPRIVIAREVERPDASDKPAIPGFISLSRADLAAADIGRMAKPGKSGGGGGGGSQVGPGDGPGGERLYNAEWYRKPTDAQLGGYLRESMPHAGWGMIACQTVANYRVDNCQILGESPRGSGFGRAVQDAAWQFQVVPPRVNSERQVGAWVRIRITYGPEGGVAG